MGCAIVGCGKAVPDLEIENVALEELVDTNNEWITTRTGIETRHIAVAETATDLGEAAARQALGWTLGGYSERRFDPSDIDLVICATVTPDSIVPSMAGLIRRRLGLDRAVAFDVNAACSGFIYGLTVAETMMAASAPNAVGSAGRNAFRRVLVVSSERLTRLTNWKDRNTCVLFGDGAGAAVLEWDENRSGILSSFIVNADDEANALTCPMTFEAPLPFDEHGVIAQATALHDRSASRVDEELAICEHIENGEPRQVLRMNGPHVFKFAAEAMTEAIHQALDRAGLSLDDLSYIVPHQANERIIKFAAKKLDLPLESFQLSIADTGNTSAASVPMALTDAYAEGHIKRGDKIALVAFGGGFTSGAIIYEA